MKNSILTILSITALMACKKNETTAINSTTDSTTVMSSPDSSMMSSDSANASAMSENVSSMTDQDKKFAESAAKGGMMEVMLGKIAETNASNAMVKSFGKMMVDDHTKANDELKTWASMVGYSLPAALDADQQKKVDDLKMKKGLDFDKAYTDLMVSDHKTVIADFKKEVADGNETALKSFASKTVPALENHLTKAEEAMKAVK